MVFRSQWRADCFRGDQRGGKPPGNVRVAVYCEVVNWQWRYGTALVGCSVSVVQNVEHGST